MSDTPETRYIRSADGTNLAYQVSGDGRVKLVFTHGTGIPIDLLSEDAGFIRLRRRLDTFSRTVWFEGRGMGASVRAVAVVIDVMGDVVYVQPLPGPVEANLHRLTHDPAAS